MPSLGGDRRFDVVGGFSVTPLAAAKRTSGIVFVVDTSASADANGALSEARSAIRALLPSIAKGTELAVVAAGSDSELLQRFTTERRVALVAQTCATAVGLFMPVLAVLFYLSVSLLFIIAPLTATRWRRHLPPPAATR